MAKRRTRKDKGRKRPTLMGRTRTGKAVRAAAALGAIGVGAYALRGKKKKGIPKVSRSDYGGGMRSLPPGPKIPPSLPPGSGVPINVQRSKAKANYSSSEGGIAVGLTLQDVEQEWAQSGYTAEFAKKKNRGGGIGSRFRKKKQGPSLMGRTLAGKAVRGAAALGVAGGGLALAKKMGGSKSSIQGLSSPIQKALPGRSGAYGGGRRMGSRVATTVKRGGRRVKAAVGNAGQRVRSYGANLRNRTNNNRKRRTGQMLLSGSSL